MGIKIFKSYRAGRIFPVLIENGNILRGREKMLRYLRKNVAIKRDYYIYIRGIPSFSLYDNVLKVKE